MSQLKAPNGNPDIRFAEGGEVNSNSFMKWFIQWYKPISKKVNIAFSLSNHLQPFKEKNAVILDVFEKIDQSIDAKPYLQEIVAKADEYEVVIYLEPKPRHKVGYFEKFGFELTPNKLFMKRKPNNPDIRFAEGGMTWDEYVKTQFNEDENRNLPSDYFEQFKIEEKNLEDYPNLLKSKNGLEYRKWKYGGIGVFDGNKIIAFADNGSIQVSPKYSKKGIGLELVSLLKEINPNHRFGNMTPQGWNLMRKYYDTYIANKPDIRFAEGGKTKRTMKRIKKGGITYGKSHAEGGIPVKNQSTGDMLEVEGGEGIVNKRSMASKSKVTLNGKEMNICQAVSELNQMEGGVKFSCEDVTDRQFLKAMAKGGELDRGTRTEQEHIQVLKDLYAKRITPKQASERIAKDHLKEDSRYYSKLAKMEGKMADGGKITFITEKIKGLDYEEHFTENQFSQLYKILQSLKLKKIIVKREDGGYSKIYQVHWVKNTDDSYSVIKFNYPYDVEIYQPLANQIMSEVTPKFGTIGGKEFTKANEYKAFQIALKYWIQKELDLSTDWVTSGKNSVGIQPFDSYMKVPKSGGTTAGKYNTEIEIIPFKKGIIKLADGGKTRKNAKITLTEAVGFDINSIDISKL
jgi:hypothetical protein